MQDEFELTYLLKEFPKNFFEEANGKEILDIYIPSIAERRILRIRKLGDRYEITKKQLVNGTDSSHQTENTISLTREEFEELAVAKGKRVRKIRYYFTEDNVNYEVDVFQDELKGLVLVDVEFKSNEEKSTFVPPHWVLADVTQEEFIAGGALSDSTYTDIEKELSRYNYISIQIALSM